MFNVTPTPCFDHGARTLGPAHGRRLSVNAKDAADPTPLRPGRKAMGGGDKTEDWTDLLLLSAGSPEALEDMATAYAGFLTEAEPAAWRAIRATVALRRPRPSHRLVVAAQTPKDAADLLRRCLNGEKTSRLAKGKSPGRPPRLALVYDGNGPQWWGMGRELYAASPIFRQAIDEIDALFAPQAGWSIAQEMRRPEADSRIGLTQIGQPLLFAQQVALTTVLSAAGIRASAVIGHSVGEVAAAWASGALTLAQAVDVIFHRSQTQIATAGSGRMAALGVGAEEAATAMEAIGGWLEIAAFNAARAVTVAGDPAALEALRDRMTAQGKFVRILPLDYPFHTKAMDVIKAPLLARLEGLAPSRGHIPFISTVTGAEIDGAALDAEYWWRNARAPVKFEAAVAHALRRLDIGLFLEVGPHPVLKDYLQQIIKSADGASAMALSTLRRPAPGRPAPELETLKTAVCAVYAAGGGDATALFEKPRVAAKLPTLERLDAAE
jgi:acyl transferase domain-containing protein